MSIVLSIGSIWTLFIGAMMLAKEDFLKVVGLSFV
jgi:hypothetical protein